MGNSGKGSEASWKEIGLRMQMVGWQHTCVHIKKSPLTHESQWDGIGKLYSSEERCCIHYCFLKASLVRIMVIFDYL